MTTIIACYLHQFNHLFNNLAGLCNFYFYFITIARADRNILMEYFSIPPPFMLFACNLISLFPPPPPHFFMYIIQISLPLFTLIFIPLFLSVLFNYLFCFPSLLCTFICVSISVFACHIINILFFLHCRRQADSKLAELVVQPHFIY